MSTAVVRGGRRVGGFCFQADGVAELGGVGSGEVFQCFARGSVGWRLGRRGAVMG